MLQYLLDQSWNNKYEKVILFWMLVWLLLSLILLNFTCVVLMTAAMSKN